METLFLSRKALLQTAKISEQDVEVNGLICPEHRYSLGKYYCAPRSCIYPNHQTLRSHNSRKKAALRPASMNYIEGISREFPFLASVGDSVCGPCRNNLESTLIEEMPDDNETEDSILEDSQGNDNEMEDPSLFHSETDQSLPEINETISTVWMILLALLNFNLEHQ